MLLKYYIIYVLFNIYLSVSASDKIPEFRLEFPQDGGKCKTSPDKPTLFRNEQFKMIVPYTGSNIIRNLTDRAKLKTEEDLPYPEVFSADPGLQSKRLKMYPGQWYDEEEGEDNSRFCLVKSCSYSDHSGYIVAVAKQIKNLGNASQDFEITFDKVREIINTWNCTLKMNTWKSNLSCSLEVYVRHEVNMEINGRSLSFPPNKNVSSTWDASGSYKYFAEEILYFKKTANIIKSLIYIKRDGETIFESHELGEIQFMLNTKYYEGPMTFYMTVSRPSDKFQETLELEMILENNLKDQKLLLQIDGVPFSPYSTQYTQNGVKEYNYFYIYMFDRTLSLDYKIAPSISDWRPDFCKGNIKVKINDSPPKYPCLLKNERNVVIEKHNIEFKYEGHMAEVPFVSGLPVNHTVYRLKNRALYEFSDGEVLSLECSYRDYDDIKWDFEGKLYDGRISPKFKLTENHDGANLSCVITAKNANMTYHIQLRMRSKDPTTIAKRLPDDRVSTPLKDVPEPSRLYIIIGIAFVVVLIVFATFCYVYKSFRKREIKKVNYEVYDNLSNESTQPQFPPNWDRINQSVPVKVEEEYSVPHTRVIEDDTYQEPACVRVGADIYTEPMRKFKKTEDTYAYVKTDKKAPSNARVEDMYAQVVPKSKRTNESNYAVIETGRDTSNYENVFKGDPYINCNTSEYAEVAYCGINDL